MQWLESGGLGEGYSDMGAGWYKDRGIVTTIDI